MTKQRLYGKHADRALARRSLGKKHRMDRMAKLMARAGKGLGEGAFANVGKRGEIARAGARRRRRCGSH